MKNSASKHAHAVVLCGLMVFGCAVFAPSIRGQEQSGEKPLGDVAREENAKQKKKAAQRYTWTDEDKGSSSEHSSATKLNTTSTPPEKPPQEQGAVSETASDTPREQNSSQPHRNALDRRKNSKPDLIIVPAGTEIKVDRSALKTTWPVRIGFNTPIPALSKVTIEDYGQIEKWGYYYEVLALTSITIDKVTYKVDAVAEVPAESAGMGISFLLNKPLEIAR